MQKGGGNYFNLFIQVDYMQGFVTHWALPWLNNMNLHEPGSVPISVPIQWTKLRPFPHYPYSYSDAVTKTIFSIHTSPQLVLAKRHNICEVTEILFVGEGRHSLLYLIEHLLSLRQNLSCQNGHFLVKLRSHTEHLRPPTAIVRCGYRTQHFLSQERLFTPGGGHSSLWTKTNIFQKSQYQRGS